MSVTFGVLMCSILETPVQMMRRKCIRTEWEIGSRLRQKNTTRRRIFVKSIISQWDGPQVLCF